jgi:hypothetical protein
MKNTIRPESIYRAAEDAILPDSAPQELLTIDEVALRPRVRPSWIYRHATDLGAIKLGKYLRFSWIRTLQHLDKDDTKTTVISGVVST